MNYHPYDPKCPHCTPAMINVKTGEVYADDSPVMVAIMKVWNAAPFKERQAYITFTCSTTPDPKDVSVATPLIKRIEDALKAIA